MKKAATKVTKTGSTRASSLFVDFVVNKYSLTQDGGDP